MVAIDRSAGLLRAIVRCVPALVSDEKRPPPVDESWAETASELAAMMATLAILVLRGHWRGFSGSVSSKDRSSRVSFASPSSRWSSGSLSSFRIGWFCGGILIFGSAVLFLFRCWDCDEMEGRGVLRKAQMIIRESHRTRKEMRVGILDLHPTAASVLNASRFCLIKMIWVVYDDRSTCEGRSHGAHDGG